MIEFHDDCINKKDLKEVFHPNSKTIEAIVEYAKRLLTRDPRNKCVRKKHLTNSYCQVHTEDGWVYRPDETVFIRFSQDVAGSANDKLYSYPSIGPARVRDEITNLASYDEDVEKNKKLQREMRLLILETSKDDKYSST